MEKKVYVVMKRYHGHDYLDRVYAYEENARAYCEKMNDLNDPDLYHFWHTVYTYHSLMQFDL